jgi:maltoporin
MHTTYDPGAAIVPALLSRRVDRRQRVPSKTVSNGRKRWKYRLLAQLLLGIALVLRPSAGAAQAASEVDQIRQELRQLQQDYQQRMERLEKRLHELETSPAPPGTNLPPPQAALERKPPSPPAQTNKVANAAAAVRAFADQQFLPASEWSEGLRYGDSPIRERLEAVLQDYVEFHGYFRAGYGRDNEGGPQVAFQAPGALSKYRLGNEAENYGEFMFAKDFYVPGLFSLEPKLRADDTPAGPIARVQTMISVYNPYENLLNSSETTFGLPEIFASIGNVVAAQPSMKFWAGSRYYRRQDIHISDFFFYNMSGSGGGVEDIQLPCGKLALAWIGAADTSGFSELPQPDPNNKAGFSKANWDLRLYDVPLLCGKGEFGVVYSRADSGLDANGRSAPASQGASFNFVHTTTPFLSQDGVNKFSLQFGTGPATTFTAGFDTFTLTNGVFIRPDPNNSWSFRATEHFAANIGEHFSVGPALVYQITDFADEGGLQQWASAGVRPIFHFNKYLNVALETGVDWVKDNNQGTSSYLWKITLAPQVSLGDRFFSRPVLRLFLTYAQWGNEFRGQIGGPDFADQTQGLTYGVQMEAWW